MENTEATTIKISDGRTVTLELSTSGGGTWFDEWAILVNECVHHYYNGTRDAAERDARQLASGLEFDLKWRAGLVS